MSEWRYIATRMNGDGTETFLDYEVPLAGASVQDVLSGHGGVDGKINPEVARMKDSKGDPLFIPWSTAIYAEASGQIRGGGIVTADPATGPDLTVDSIGFTGFLAEQPFIGEQKYDTADPLQIDRFIIEEYQKRKPFNLGLKPVGATKSRQVQMSESVSGIRELYYLAYWQTLDLDRERTQLTEMGEYEWRVKHRWSGEQIIHEIEYGYPQLGRRRPDLKFVVGENLMEPIPVKNDATNYASHVLVVGAGQGRKMITAYDSRPTKRLGRWEVVSDKSISKDQIAKSRVDAELKKLTGDFDITEIEVTDHENARFGTYQPGDEIYVESGPGWHDFGGLWVRVLGIIYNPEKNTATVQVRRSEKVT